MKTNSARPLRLVLTSLTLLAALCIAGCQRTTTILMVRHAEPLGSGSDPGLSPAGQQRALALRDAVLRARISTIYTSDLRRTQETAAPLATATGLTPHVVSVGSDVPLHAQAIAGDIKQHHVGSVVLVVGHTNTLPLIMAALGLADPLPVIGATEFGNLFILTLKEKSTPGLTHARYGL